ncbi:MAG TPA: glutathione binding-like protein [Polyangiaceae bacterium]|nr:glutathione binding-like protein [Polyangiaceae bacterium]
MKIFGHPGSTCTRKVLMTLAETQTPYEFILVELGKGEHKQQPHLSRQPFGQVPALEDENLKMYESRAIARYINRKVGGKLEPSDLVGQARMEQWISVETSNFSGAAMKFIFQHTFGRAQAKEVLDAAQKQIDLALDVLNAALDGREYLVGDQFTLADVCFMPYFEYLMNSPEKESITKRAAVRAWWSRVGERPAWRKVAGR